MLHLNGAANISNAVDRGGIPIHCSVILFAYDLSLDDFSLWCRVHFVV
jgi:hypothetical protein